MIGDVSHILGPHWIGSRPTAGYHDDFDLVVSVARSRPADNLWQVPVVWLPFPDSHRRPPMERLVLVADMVHAADPGRCLWHCAAGLNRSSLALGVYLVRHAGGRPADVVEWIRAKRAPAALFNATFVEALHGLQ